jgi:hypothetical protein
MTQFKYLCQENVVLQILVNGCNQHPSYRAKRQPRCECNYCKTMWSARQKLIALSQINKFDF